MRELIVADKKDIVSIADAIRAKIKSSDGMTIEEMAELIESIESGGGISVSTSASKYIADEKTMVVADITRSIPTTSAVGEIVE